MDYIDRIADKVLDDRLETFGAVLIDGPRGCGKSATARQRAKSVVEFRDGDRREALLATADAMPSKLLKGDRPVLLDEWQDAPKIWGAVRKSVDDEGGKGMYILTGTSSRFVETPHTGTGRISTMTMLPMSLYESGESDGTVSLKALFDSPESYDGCESSLSVDDLIYAICRGGWPNSVACPPADPLAVAKDIFDVTVSTDVSRIDGVRRNPDTAGTVLRSYARNISTLSNKKTIYGDVASVGISEKTMNTYIQALEKLYVIDDIPAWCPAIRNRTTVRASSKRNFCDPSLAVAALGIGPDYFDEDFLTLGFLFESLCIRDLRVYSSPLGGHVSYYRDREGLEADCVLRLENGKYALIEFKLGQRGIDEGSKHLCRIEGLIRKKREEDRQSPLRLPVFKAVVTATQYGYRREDGVLVVPIGCLRD